VVLAVFSAAVLTSIGMFMDFCVPVPPDMRQKKGDQQIYFQKIIRGVVGVLIMALEVYEVFYLQRLHRCRLRALLKRIRFAIIVLYLISTHKALHVIYHRKPVLFAGTLCGLRHPSLSF
jgi:hypothetical protein